MVCKNTVNGKEYHNPADESAVKLADRRQKDAGYEPLTLGIARKAKAHCTLQTWSFRMSCGVKPLASTKQLSIFSDWQIG